MEYLVTLLRTPKDGFPVMRAGVKLDAGDAVEASLRGVATMEEEMPGTTGEWWAVAAVPADPQWDRQIGHQRRH